MMTELNYKLKKLVTGLVMAGMLTCLLPVAALGNNCTIVTIGALAFGTIYLPAASTVYADTEISVTCDNGVPYTIGIDSGLYGTREMSAGGSSRLPYEIYMDSSLRKPWGDGDQYHSPKKSDTGSGSVKHHHLYGVAMPSNQTGVGRYSDELMITIEW